MINEIVLYCVLYCIYCTLLCTLLYILYFIVYFIQHVQAAPLFVMCLSFSNDHILLSYNNSIMRV